MDENLENNQNDQLEDDDRLFLYRTIYASLDIPELDSQSIISTILLREIIVALTESKIITRERAEDMLNKAESKLEAILEEDLERAEPKLPKQWVEKMNVRARENASNRFRRIRERLDEIKE